MDKPLQPDDGESDEETLANYQPIPPLECGRLVYDGDSPPLSGVVVTSGKNVLGVS